MCQHQFPDAFREELACALSMLDEFEKLHVAIIDRLRSIERGSGQRLHALSEAAYYVEQGTRDRIDHELAIAIEDDGNVRFATEVFAYKVEVEALSTVRLLLQDAAAIAPFEEPPTQASCDDIAF